MPSICLVGLPNSGKSALFNTLTKSTQRVANYPGITVEKKTGTLKYKGKEFEVIDLPGIYSLDIASLDEKVTRDYILDKRGVESESTFVLVIDATNLKRSLYLAKQLQEIGRKFIVALNMMDLSDKRGQEIDLKALSNELGGAYVYPIVAVTAQGTDHLIEAAVNTGLTRSELAVAKDFQLKIKDPSYIKKKLSETEKILARVILKKISSDTLTEKLDCILLHPQWGVVFLLFILIIIFQLLFVWSDPFMEMIENLFEWMASVAAFYLPEGHWRSLVVDGIIAGVGGVMVFLPHIIFLFMIINFLEDFGYLGRAAFLLDYLMRKFGLPGKAVIPLLSSHACAIPGIMSARIIENPAQRLITMMVAPLTTCSARLPVYTLLIGVMFPNETVLGFLKLPGLVLFGFYLFGIISAFIVAAIAKKAYTPISPSYLLMELPPYRFPKFSTIIKNALKKGGLFVKKAGTVILLFSIVLWGLVTFPKAPPEAQVPSLHYSYAAMVGKTLGPLFRPLGFDWRITTALIPSFGAREVLVAAMATVYAVELEGQSSLENLSGVLGQQYSFATLMSLLVWFVFAPQCIATFGVLRKETNGYKMPFIFGAYTLFLSYAFSALTYFFLSL